jgi:hypothetical protein
MVDDRAEKRRQLIEFFMTVEAGAEARLALAALACN